MADKTNPSAIGEEPDKAYSKHKRRTSPTSEKSHANDKDFKPSWKTKKAAEEATMVAHRQTDNTVYQLTFGTTELLENIMVHLPPRTILARMLGVSKFWNNAINASPAIQTKLWKRPLSDRVSSPVGLAYPYPKYYNAGVMFFAFGLPMYSGSYRINAVFPGAPTQVARYQNLAYMRFGVQPVYIEKTITRLGKTLVHVTITGDGPSRARRETPSWLDMHVSDPPITTAWVEVFADTRPMESGPTSKKSDDLRSLRNESENLIILPGVTTIEATLRDSGGVTFGMVKDLADKIAAQSYHPRMVREESLVGIRICFVVDSAEISLPGMPGPTRFRVR